MFRRVSRYTPQSLNTSIHENFHVILLQKIITKQLCKNSYERNWNVWEIIIFFMESNTILDNFNREAFIRRCSVKKMFLEISQNSQENTCARASFLIKLHALGKFYKFSKSDVIWWCRKMDFYFLLNGKEPCFTRKYSNKKRGGHVDYDVDSVALFACANCMAKHTDEDERLRCPKYIQ